MNKNLIIFSLVAYIYFCNITFANYTVSGKVQNEDGTIVKKGRITLVRESDGEEIKKTKVSKRGKFKLKKINNGRYKINFSGDIDLSSQISVMDDDIQDFIIIIKDVEKIPEQLSQETEVLDEPNVETLNTPLKTERKSELLPQLRPHNQVDRLEFEEQFFEYESNLRKLKNQIDSLKSIVTAFEKKQTMPNVSREILELIKVPEFQYRIELKNGTVVSGDILNETDSSLILKTQIGQLVLKKEMVIRRNKHEEPKPKVIFLGDPFINIYPDRHEFSGRVKNVGEKRADFVRVISNLFTQTTKPAGQDSVFVKGSRIIYDSGIIADTALEPGQTATYNFPVKIINRRKVQYHTMDIHWNTSE